MEAAPFDADAFRERTRQLWQGAAESWFLWAPQIQEWLAPVTEKMIDLAKIKPGDKVLDVAAGAGEPAVTIARLVGPDGSVAATDLSERILEFAATYAAQEGVTNVTTEVMDGESLAFPDATFDAAVSRLGVIYFPDRVAALRSMRRVLAPKARVSIVGITNPEANPFSQITMSVIAHHSKLPPPPPGSPGPYSLGDPDVMRSALSDAGFIDIDVEIVDAPLRMSTAHECERFQREAFAGLNAMIDDSEREAVWNEVAVHLLAFERDGTFESPAQFIVGAGTKA